MIDDENLIKRDKANRKKFLICDIGLNGYFLLNMALDLYLIVLVGLKNKYGFYQQPIAIN
jgi:hypothetical protein